MTEPEAKPMIARALIVILGAVALLFTVASRAKADGNPFSGAVSITITLTPVKTGKASFYGGRHHGQPMANGQIYNQESDSCAHRNLPFGTRLSVARRDGRSVICTVRDRGPFVRGRIVDLSVRHARALGMIGAGVVPVTVEVVP